MLSFNLNVMVPNNMNSIFFLGGQFAPDGGGQFESDCIGQPNHLRGGQFDRCLQGGNRKSFFGRL